MHSMIIIVQTFTSALAFEYGPYPDLSSCELDIPRHEVQIKQMQPTLLKMLAECRELSDPANEIEDRGVRPMPDGVS